jgi:hypothetical protein
VAYKTGENKMKKIIALLLQLTLIFALAACSAVGTASGTTSQTAAESVTADAAAVVVSPLSVEYDSEDLNPSTDASATIQLNGDSISTEGVGATVNGGSVTITAAGTYNISGTLNDGQIIVDTEDEGAVNLVLNGATINNSTSAPIYVRSADKTVITLADGTQNAVTDGAAYTYDDAEAEEPNAAIFSKDDLTINGGGSLTVTANFNDGITSKDDLKITGGVITVNAVNDGIRGRNYLAVKDGTITVNALGDGLQSNNDEDATKGYVLIEGGTINLNTGMDGIQAETQLTVSGGTLNIFTGVGSTINYELENSAKGLRAGMDITITGGTINIDSADDAIHSNGSLTMDGGDITIASGDDGIHSDATLTINNGTVNITKSYEGIESEIITLNGGTIHLIAADDGLNAAGGADGSSVNGRAGENPFAESGNAYIYINGGYLYVDSVGDGIDSNGSIEMTAGTAIVNGPTNNGNGPLDYNGTFNISGGYFLAVGSSGMAQNASESSTQYSVLYGFDTMQAAGTLIRIENESSEEILTFAPAKSYQSVVLSSPELGNGSYVLYSGGASSGSSMDGLYSDGTYTAGTQVATFTVSSVVTSTGTVGGFGGGGPRGGPGEMPGGGQPPQPMQ